MTVKKKLSIPPPQSLLLIDTTVRSNGLGLKNNKRCNIQMAFLDDVGFFLGYEQLVKNPRESKMVFPPQTKKGATSSIA